ncbi:MAG: outer membrane beta-barrel protein [Deltaproteobacteria bacterium]|nr:outer membrane beta-barrel protein [Deltaproteobacteria bacterium]
MSVAPPALAQLTTGSTGIKLGEGRLHPYLQLDTRYLINPGRIPDDTSTTSPPNDMAVTARLGAEYALPSDSLDLKFTGEAEYQHFLGLDDEETTNLSTFAGQAGVTAIINKEGAVTIRLRDRVIRSGEPANETLNTRLLRWANDFGVGVDLRPGGGALIFSPDYGFFIEYYDRIEMENNPNYDPSIFDNMRHNPKLRVAWKFLPKTAIFLEGDALFTQYYSSNVNDDSTIVQGYLGAAGNVTAKLSALIKGGYGATFYSSGDNFQSAVGQAEVDYQASEIMKARLGVTRTVQPTSLFRYVVILRGYLGYDHLLGGRFLVQATGSYSDLRYGDAVEDPNNAGTPVAIGDRVDSSIQGDLALSYAVTEWITVGISDRLELRRSNYSGLSQPDYLYNETFLRVTVRY